LPAKKVFQTGRLSLNIPINSQPTPVASKFAPKGLKIVRKDDRIKSNRTILANQNIQYAIIRPTKTAFKKGILDAIENVRSYFVQKKFHNYQTQKQGPDFKKYRTTFLYTKSGIITAKASLYRPKTKNGDPRMWFSSKIKKISVPGDYICIIIRGSNVHLLNLSKLNFEKSLADNDHIGTFLSRAKPKSSLIVQELLIELKRLAKKPIPAHINGDTAIGMAIEKALGIRPNSSKKPDYKGIELKSARRKRNRANLFCQVPDWSISAVSSTKEILEKYGRKQAKEDELRLCNTSSTRNFNSHGLTLKYVDAADELLENHGKANVAKWTGKKLRDRLLEKHAETFWIKASSHFVKGKEYFELESVIHTRAPLLNQLMPLIASGDITMDHMISIEKKKGRLPKLKEKGPSFKIKKTNLGMLFPNPITYSLI
jgi:hypothetical protein